MNNSTNYMKKYACIGKSNDYINDITENVCKAIVMTYKPRHKTHTDFHSINKYISA